MSIRSASQVMLVSLMVLACDNDSDAPGSEDDLARLGRIAGAACNRARKCCEAGGFSTTSWAACEMKLFARNDLETSVREGKVRVDPDLTTTCVALLAQNSCSAPDSAAPSCDAVLRGTVPEGGACRHGSECANNGVVFCEIVGSTAPDSRGICRTIPVAAAGAACTDTIEDGSSFTSYVPVPGRERTRCRRKDGLTCDARRGICLPVHALGEACVRIEDCSQPLVCSETCQAPQPADSNCRLGRECASGACRDGKCSSTLADQRTCERGVL